MPIIHSFKKMNGGEERLSASNILAGVLLKDLFLKIHQKRQQANELIDVTDER